VLETGFWKSAMQHTRDPAYQSCFHILLHSSSVAEHGKEGHILFGGASAHPNGPVASFAYVATRCPCARKRRAASFNHLLRICAVSSEMKMPSIEDRA
jgi:hypothetical protein